MPPMRRGYYGSWARDGLFPAFVLGTTVGSWDSGGWVAPGGYGGEYDGGGWGGGDSGGGHGGGDWGGGDWTAAASTGWRRRRRWRGRCDP